MAVIKTLAVAAQDTWSTSFQLQGDDSVPGKGLLRRALINISGGSTVTVRRMSGATVLSSKTMTSTSVLEVPVTGDYQVGVATGGFVDATTITVEQ